MSTDDPHGHASGLAAGYGRLDEAAVLTRLQEGDEALFRDVVVQLTPVLTRLARSYTPTAAAAQDAVQDTWLVVLDKLDTFEGRSSLKTWICGILVNKARRSGVREHRTLPFSSAWRDDRSPAVDPARFHGPGSDGPTGTWASPPVRWDHLPEDRLAASELRRVIDSAIAALPTRQREVMMARDVLGMDAEETALIMGLTPGNQRVLLHRARSKVRAALEQYGAEVVDEQPACAAPGPADAARAAPRQRLSRNANAQPRAPGQPATATAPTSDDPPEKRSSP
ncbi:MAG: sigma-70 family RNA polymerase sigma factor [Actinobacteria bacterium]|nr:sigma-70 family RNA polymerase sigma factor [Actinomycetota bacterium]MCA1720821.1 sigma-70 family RNA polymerase sigma factor [Actinomycetota bacterium]